jgi:hypothetical protein
MSSTVIDRTRAMAEQALIYVPQDSESIRISHCEEDAFYGTGEDSGDEYKIHYEDVNLNQDLFYKLVPITR